MEGIVNKIFAYIDESGNHDLETAKKGASKYFIVCALLIDEGSLHSVTRDAENIRKKHFQTGEMKSSGVKDKDNHHRRGLILRDILDLDFKFFAVCIDKSALDRDSGMGFKKSFLKNVNGMLYNRLFSTYQDIEIYADEHGSEEYKKSFANYIDKNHKPDLFWKSEMHLVPSKDNVLIQLSDFVVGSIAKIYEGKKAQNLTELYLEMLNDKGLDLIEWPTKYQTYFSPDKTVPEYDGFIHKHALAKAEIFLEQNQKRKDDETQLQVCVLGYLVFHSRLVVESGYITTKELLNHLEDRGFKKVSEQAIRSSIISKLRDKDVIISSCNKGYKIPCCYGDLFDFVTRVNSQVVPLLDRLNKARNSYLLASKDEVDLLKGPHYPHLVAFLEQLNK